MKLERKMRGNKICDRIWWKYNLVKEIYFSGKRENNLIMKKGEI